jgi:hypothetical protein
LPHQPQRQNDPIHDFPRITIYSLFLKKEMMLS